VWLLFYPDMEEDALVNVESDDEDCDDPDERLSGKYYL